MNKQMIIDYLNEIWPYLKLSEICKKYNENHPDKTVDYNNLRNVLKGTAPNRLSEEKLLMFYDFLVKDIFQEKFKIKSNELNTLNIIKTIQGKSSELICEISEALEHGFSNK